MALPDFINPALSKAICLAIAHSFWMGILALLLLRICTPKSILRNADAMYRLHVISLVLLFFGTIASFFIIVANPGIVDSSTYLSPFKFQPSDVIETHAIYSNDIHGLISQLWFFGFIIFLAKFAVANIQIQYLRITAITAPFEWTDRVNHWSKKMNLVSEVLLLSSEKIFIPMVIGVVRPMILFPASLYTHLQPEEIESIIIHELSHIKRYDYIFNLLQGIIECILFFNPFVWWLNKQIRKYREYRCDDIVQNTIPSKRHYLEALYKVANHTREKHSLAPALLNNKSLLLMRIQRMVNHKNKDLQVKPMLGLLVTAIFLISILSFKAQNEPVLSLNLTETKAELALQNELIPVLAEIKAITSNHDRSSVPKLAIEPKTKIAADRSPTNSTPITDTHINTVAKLANSPATNFLSIPMLADTIKKSKRIKELEKQMEVKAKEMEVLAEQFSNEIERKIEMDAKKMEELSEQLELEMEKMAIEIEENAIDEEKIQELERLGEEMAVKSEFMAQELETLHENEEIEQLHIALEKNAEEIEKLHETNESTEQTKQKMKKVEAELKVINEKIHKHMREIQEKQHEVQRINRNEMRELQHQIRATEREMRRNQQDQQRLMNNKGREIEREMQSIQHKMQQKGHQISHKLQQAMREKEKEIREIARQMEIEMKKQENKKNN